MSHYSVLVIGENVEEQLAPFHEFECTGDDNEYVQDVDDTEEARESYKADKTTMYKDPDGNLHSPWTKEGHAKSEFYRDPTPKEEKEREETGYSNLSCTSQDWGDGRGYRDRIKCLPEGWQEVEVLTSSVETFAEFIKGYYGHEPVAFGESPDLDETHKYGYVILDEKGEVVRSINRTNPNKKWDCWTLGGRWNGFFKTKKAGVGVMGAPGLQSAHEDYEPPTDDRADVCTKDDIDIDGMRDEAEREAGKSYDLYSKIVAGLPPIVSWEATVEKHNKDYAAAREEYNAQPAVLVLRKNEETTWYDADDYLCSREVFIQRSRNAAFSTFAVVKDGKWYERGEMGWWGVVRDEKDADEWYTQFASLVDSLPGDTVMTVVDCHI